MPFLRRLALAPLVFLAVAAVTYGMPRVLRPELYPGEPLVSGLAGDLERVLLHLDFGCSALLAGCPPIRELWVEGMAWDLWLVGGATALGTAAGIAAGRW